MLSFTFKITFLKLIHFYNQLLISSLYSKNNITTDSPNFHTLLFIEKTGANLYTFVGQVFHFRNSTFFLKIYFNHTHFSTIFAALK